MCYLIKHFQTHTQHKQEKVQLTGSRSLISLVQFSHSVMSDSLWPHGVQHARPPCPSPTSGACSNSCPSSGWCHPTISSCLHLLLLPSIFPSIRVFSNESILWIRWPKYWRFSINPSNEYSGLISVGWTDWISLQSKRLSRVFSNNTPHHSSKVSILQPSNFFMVQLSHSYMTTGKAIALTIQT